MIDQEAVLDLMTNSEAVYLATVSDGAPRMRALVNLRRPDRYPGSSAFCRSEGFVSYLATSAASGKVADIRAGSPVAVYYCEPNETHGVELRGRAEILTDAGIKRALWSEDWRIYWSGPDDPDYVVLRVRPEQIDGWWGTTPLQVETAGA